MVREWSLKDDSLLYSSRLALLHQSPEGLKLRTEGYQWYQKNKLGPQKILCVNPRSKYTVTESPEFRLGVVKTIWVVNSESDQTGQSLKIRAKVRIAERGSLTTQSFEKYLEMRTSCWVVEEVSSEDGSDFFCDCPKGMKVNKF